MGKRAIRWKAAEALAMRKQERSGKSPESTYEEVEKAYHLVNRLARLAHDNETRCERDNDIRYWQGDRLQRRHEKFTERWLERADEIESAFGEYGCHVSWPGIYPVVEDAQTRSCVIFTDAF